MSLLLGDAEHLRAWLLAVSSSLEKCLVGSILRIRLFLVERPLFKTRCAEVQYFRPITVRLSRGGRRALQTAGASAQGARGRLRGPGDGTDALLEAMGRHGPGGRRAAAPGGKPGRAVPGAQAGAGGDSWARAPHGSRTPGPRGLGRSGHRAGRGTIQEAGEPPPTQGQVLASAGHTCPWGATRGRPR